MPNPHYLTVAQTAELLQVCRETVYTWIRNREIDYFRIGGGGLIRIPREALEGFLQPAVNPPPPQTRPDRSREIAARLKAQHRLQKMIEENRRR